MTAQVPDKLINEYPSLDLGELELHAVIYEISEKSGWGDGYLFSAKPKRVKWLSTACWRGYVATFRVTVKGELELVEYRYSLAEIEPPIAQTVWHSGEPEHAPDQVHERATGDFLLVMKENFYGPRTYIPFRDGRVVVDRSQWIYEVKPEKMINKHQDLDLGGLQLYGVIRGDITDNDGGGIPYEFLHQPTPMYRGKRLEEWSTPTFHVKDNREVTLEINHSERPDGWFKPAFCVTTKGEFELVEYNHPYQKDQTDEIHETATGDFWLVMREHFSQPRIYIPFRDGQVVMDRSEWHYEREPDILINDYPGLKLDGVRFEAVTGGDPPGTPGWDASYRFSAQPKLVRADPVTRPYAATFRLTAAGGLELVDYRYPTLPEDQRDVVGEMAEGDFWLVMRAYFPEPRIYIPFRDGKVVLDRSEWHYERSPDWLLCEYPGLNLDALYLVAVMVGETPGTPGWGTPYRFSTRPRDVQTDLATKPFETTLHLKPDGTLELARYRYLTLQEDRRDEVQEKATGDFWLVLQRPWTGPLAYIPFHDGRIADRSQWLLEQESSSKGL